MTSLSMDRNRSRLELITYCLDCHNLEDGSLVACKKRMFVIDTRSHNTLLENNDYNPCYRFIGLIEQNCPLKGK